MARRVEINIAEHAARQFLRRYGVVFRDPLRSGQEIRVSAADPLNLAGVILPGPRVPSNPHNYIVFRNGVAVHSGETSNLETINSQVG